jgi:hypothetical protein
MSLAYQIMYRLGVTPWEHREPPEPLAGLIEGPRALPPVTCSTSAAAPVTNQRKPRSRRDRAIRQPALPPAVGS